MHQATANFNSSKAISVYTAIVKISRYTTYDWLFC